MISSTFTNDSLFPQKVKCYNDQRLHPFRQTSFKFNARERLSCFNKLNTINRRSHSFSLATIK